MKGKAIGIGVILCIAMFGLVSAVSAEEATIEQVLNDYFGAGMWTETTKEECTFTSGGYTATTILINKSSGYPNPTGWYEVGISPIYHELYNPVVENDIRQFTTDKEFGIYIDSDEGTFHTQKSENPDGANHTRIFEIQGGSQESSFVIAFEDMRKPCDEDYQDIVIWLKGEDINMVPEFSTVAIPAAAVIGLFLFFNRRKQKEQNN